MPPFKRTVFFGTPDFAVPTLQALIDADRKPLAVITRPARPVGRGKEITEPPVADLAREQGIDVLQPESVRDEAFLDQMRALKPDVAVVVAFGQIFPPELLEIPKKGCVNVHASLLPKYRGPSPIQGALMRGEKKTGVTIMRMEEEMDAGPILNQEEVLIRPTITNEKLRPKLARVGARLLVETLAQLEKGKIKERKQREESSSYSHIIHKADGKMDWALGAGELYDRLRAFTPWPGMTAHFKGRPVRIVWGVPMTWEQAPMGVSGTYLGLRQGRMAILCGGDSVFGIEELQRPGKRPLRALDFVNGERVRVGESFA